MSPKTRRVLLAGTIVGLLAGESAWFLSRLASSILLLRGEHAFYRNALVPAWASYGAALRWGAEREAVESNQLELLLFGLDQSDARIRIDLPLPPATALKVARQLTARLIQWMPFSAYHWSLASDVYVHSARTRRRQDPIDLSRLSEDPIENMLPEEWVGVACLEVASRLEPTNYLYPDLLAEMFLEIGSPARAAAYCRRAVAINPDLRDHLYLQRPDLAPELLEAALLGFADASTGGSIVPVWASECDAARLLTQNGQERRALPHLERALAAAPGLAEVQAEMGYLQYRLHDYRKALEYLQAAIRIDPEPSWPHYTSGLCYLALGQPDQAIPPLSEARDRDPSGSLFLQSLGEAFEKHGQIQDAERQFKASANLHPGERDAWLSLLAFYLRHKDLQVAPGTCEKVIALDPADPTYREQCALLGEAP
jgi:tetratricopeptide (TPR) repeat protein